MKNKIIEKTKIDQVLAPLLECLEYCVKQNGRPDCKNCGFNEEMVKNLKTYMFALERDSAKKGEHGRKMYQKAYDDAKKTMIEFLESN